MSLRVTRLPGHATMFSVEGESFGCSRTSYCDYVNSSQTPTIAGRNCPKCGLGVLERRNHQVDLAINQCGCEDFKTRKSIAQSLLTDEEIASMTQDKKDTTIRCKHLRAARAFLCGDGDALDALLQAVPQQREDGP